MLSLSLLTESLNVSKEHFLYLNLIIVFEKMDMLFTLTPTLGLVVVASALGPEKESKWRERSSTHSTQPLFSSSPAATPSAIPHPTPPRTPSTLALPRNSFPVQILLNCGIAREADGRTKPCLPGSVLLFSPETSSSKS